MLVWNFFSTSPLSQRWRLLYGLMDQLGLLSAQQRESMAYTRFDLQQHYLLCSGAYIIGERVYASRIAKRITLFPSFPALGKDSLGLLLTGRLGGRPLGFPGSIFSK